MLEEFSSSNKVHKEIDTVLFLEDIIHADEEGMSHLQEDLLLKTEVFKLFIIDDDVFPNTFHGINLLLLVMLNQEHFTERALADDALDNKVF